MGNFTLENILPANNTDFSKGVYIILFNATNLPPHLLLSAEGKIYSITDSGRQIGSSLEKLVLFIERKKVPGLFVEWSIPETLKGNFENSVKNIFLRYDRVVEGKVSCLFPIRDVVAEILGDEMQKADFIFELLPLMQEKKVLGNIFSLNMENHISNGKFELLTYTNEDLQKSLQASQTR